MTQEVINDICARLPHEIFIHYAYRDIRGRGWPTDLNLTHFASDEESVVEFLEDGDVEDPKPYLRPMSSMTEEEKEEYDKWHEELEEGRIKDWKYANYIDWLNEHHLDYRGLIEKGLALESPEGMYKQ